MPCTYLAQHELKNVILLAIITTVITLTVTIAAVIAISITDYTVTVAIHHCYCCYTCLCGSRELDAETEMVMQLWEERNGLSRHQISSIRRVQNMPLWTKYALTRAEIQASLVALLLPQMQHAIPTLSIQELGWDLNV